MNDACSAINNLSAFVTFSSGVMKIGMTFFFPVKVIASTVKSIFSFLKLIFNEIPFEK